MKRFLFFVLIALVFYTVKAQSVSYSIEPIMITVQGGTFKMGSNEGEDEKPIHEVNISSFKMSKYEITQAQFRAITGINPSYNKGCDNCPVELVSWGMAQEYISDLNKKYPGKGYRLPTEAEWEYAARGGNLTHRYSYSGSNNINDVAWYEGNKVLAEVNIRIKLVQKMQMTWGCMI